MGYSSVADEKPVGWEEVFSGAKKNWGGGMIASGIT